ncbi:sensor histidine kinase [Desulfovermiculus halophilus]|uniref:sensor histidine kinase n=1 Tax=Desulfovermiculus halophilus TaxID=339722 RepID=UPI00054D34F5|nr:PAS domain-containing sensor histidine kinase [Desulfovermiculus halophilus]
MQAKERIIQLFHRLFILPDQVSEDRYVKLRRNMAVLMFLVTLIPLSIMLLINFHQYQSALTSETVNQLRVLENKAKHSFELFLQERLSAVKYIANAYSINQLKEEGQLSNIFYTMQQNFSGFVDIGLIDPSGMQINYVGPYDLEGKDYTGTHSFQEVRIKGTYISDVFMGYRRFPHLIVAVERRDPNGQNWVIRASIDIDTFNDIIASMGLEADSDAFLLNQEGIIQTPSKFYGGVLDKSPIELPPKSFQPTVLEMTDPDGREIFLSYVYFSKQEFVLFLVKERSLLLRSWYALKGQMLVVFSVSLILIAFVIFRLTGALVRRIKQADERRELAFRELEHSQKLSSIGQMAAGVAHEINNPLAIINEKAGLMQDVLERTDDFRHKDKFLGLVASIIRSVERARGITYRLLGFARRLETHYEILDINQILREVLGFLEKEAEDRNVRIELDLAEELPKIHSDQGQLEQVFLNLISNALAAVQDHEGRIQIRTWEINDNTLAMSIDDNGCGMSNETLRHIFEPFFTTKKGYGTGLGLSITYGIIKKLGGDIKVASEEGVGSTFTVYLPVKYGNVEGTV